MSDQTRARQVKTIGLVLLVAAATLLGSYLYYLAVPGLDTDIGDRVARLFGTLLVLELIELGVWKLVR